MGEDWKYQMLLQADEEEKALCIERQRSRTICELLLKAEESWRLNALSEAANAGFWLAHLVSRCEYEWQSRLLLIGQKDKVEKWRLEHIPEIQREDMAANFLFKSGWNSNIPRWKFELGLKVEMAALCREGWRLDHLDQVSSRSVGELLMKAGEQWKVSLLLREGVVES